MYLARIELLSLLTNQHRRISSTFSNMHVLLVSAMLLGRLGLAEDLHRSSCSADGTDCQMSHEMRLASIRPIFDESLNELDQTDPKLIEYIREHVLIPPPDPSVPLTYPETRGTFDGSRAIQAQYGQPVFVEGMYNCSKYDGFFIEAGAFNGIDLSNSLYFERKYGWTGLLVEPNPEALETLFTVNRQAWILPSCFSTKKTPEIVTFDMVGLLGGIRDENGEALISEDGVSGTLTGQTTERKDLRVQCFPMYSVLMALGNPTVDYFTLDIEGAEYNVLSTVPLEKVNINLFDIEMNHAGQLFDKNTRMDIRNLLKLQGYRFYSRVNIDEIFVKKDAFLAQSNTDLCV